MSEDWVQELKDEAKVKSVHVPTDSNLADMLTKGLPAEVRNKLDAIMARIARGNRKEIFALGEYGPI